jgi:hypothetical protein
VIDANELYAVVDPVDIFTDSGVGARILADHAAFLRHGDDQGIGRAAWPVELVGPINVYTLVDVFMGHPEGDHQL